MRSAEVNMTARCNRARSGGGLPHVCGGHVEGGMKRLSRGRVFELLLVHVELATTRDLARERGRVLPTPHDAARVLAPFLEQAPATRRLALALVDGRRRLQAVALLDGREWSACCLRPSEVFAPAIVAGASGLYLAHRHPSDTLWALRADFRSMEGVAHMRGAVHVEVHDHLIFDARGRYASLQASPWPWSRWRSATSTTRLALSPCVANDEALGIAPRREEVAHA